MTAAASTSSAATTDPLPRDAWWMLAVLLALYVMSYLDRMTIVLLVDPLKAALRLTDFQVSLLMGPAFAISFAVFGFPIGWAIDRYPRRITLFLGAAAWSVMTVFCGLSRTFTSLFAARLGVGATEAAIMPAAYSLIADKFPKARLTTALSIYAMGPKTGQAVSLFVGGLVILAATRLAAHPIPLLGHVERWQLVFLMLGAPSLLVSLLAWSFSEPARRVSALAADDNGSFVSFAWRHRALIALLWLGYSTMSAVTGGLISWAPTYLSRHFGWAAPDFGPVLAAVNILAALTMPLNGLVVDRIYRGGVRDAHTRVYTWLLCAVIPVFAVLPLLPGRTAFLVAYWALQCISSSFMVYMSATLQMMVPNQLRGRASALFILGINLIGTGVGPVAVATITQFVFHDPGRVGEAIAITGACGSALALVALRLPLKALGAAVERNLSPPANA